MPYVSKPVSVNGTPYLDGGCACKIPYRWAIDNGYEKIIVIKTRDDNFRKKVSENKSHFWLKRFYHKYPEFAASLANSNAEYNRQCDEISKLRQYSRVFVISPSKSIDISRFDGNMETLGTLYFFGYNDTKNQFDELKEYLK